MYIASSIVIHHCHPHPDNRVHLTYSLNPYHGNYRHTLHMLLSCMYLAGVADHMSLSQGGRLPITTPCSKQTPVPAVTHNQTRAAGAAMAERTTMTDGAHFSNKHEPFSFCLPAHLKQLDCQRSGSVSAARASHRGLCESAFHAAAGQRCRMRMSGRDTQGHYPVLAH